MLSNVDLVYLLLLHWDYEALFYYIILNICDNILQVADTQEHTPQVNNGDIHSMYYGEFVVGCKIYTMTAIRIPYIEQKILTLYIQEQYIMRIRY